MAEAKKRKQDILSPVRQRRPLAASPGTFPIWLIIPGCTLGCIRANGPFRRSQS